MGAGHGRRPSKVTDHDRRALGAGAVVDRATRGSRPRGAGLHVIPGMGHHLFCPGSPVEVADLIALRR
jgi:hypothetical protein